MANEIESVVAFIQRATKIYKYTKPTGYNLKNSIDVISQVLQEDERSSLELLVKNADDIIQRLDNKSPGRYTPASLMTYKSRALRAIDDYEKYGKDISKLNSMPSQAARKPKAEKKNPASKQIRAELMDTPHNRDAQVIDVPMVINGSTFNTGTKMQNLDLPLKDDRSVVIYYPADLTVNEAEKIAKVLGGIAALTEE